MKRTPFAIFSILFLVVSFAGCAQQPKAANSQQAVEQSKAFKTAEEQAKYLVGQANAFVNSKNFDQAIQTAQYVLSNLDANSQDAKSTIEKATAELKKMAQQKADEVKKNINSFGK